MGINCNYHWKNNFISSKLNNNEFYKFLTKSKAHAIVSGRKNVKNKNANM